MALDERAVSAALRPGVVDADVAALRAALGPGRQAPIPKVHTAGTHRAEPPETTLARLLPLLADHGITRVSRITGFDRAGVEVTTAVRPNARALSVANGKGLTLAAARVSAIMEAIERWHGEHPLLPLRFGDRDDVAALGAAAHLDLPRAADGAPGDPGAILWAPALDLATGDAALVPFDTVDTSWLAARPPSPFFTSTNGLASGSNPVEAALHGLCELVEHDSLALFDRLAPESRAARRIAPETVDDPDAAALLDRLASRDFAVGLWDATSDIGIPVILAALVDERAPRTPAGFGSGCHPDAAVAACRALTEAAQTRLIALTGTRDDLAPALFGGGIGVRFRWALREDEAAPPRRWRPCSLATDDLRADLAAGVAAVTAAGPGPVLAVDLSRTPGIAVIRILVPGLEAGTADEGARPDHRAAHAAEHMR
jgi:ribosomal protein S12 methylthiotransferase accessory factor